MSNYENQLNKVKSANGFIAALDQSGGSTPKALQLYGIGEDAYQNDEEMFSVVHQMRSRIITSPAFDGDRILGAILFENTLDRKINGMNTASYLWEQKNVAPFLKIDKGLDEETDGVQVMNPNPTLMNILKKAKDNDVFGTKMRSVIKSANKKGIEKVVAQQFEVGKKIISAGLTPIIEPEVDIHASDKAHAETLLRDQLLIHLDELTADEMVIFKLTLPEQPNFYDSCKNHPNLLRLVALSGGYTRVEANHRLSLNNGMIASFSRALTESLNDQQSDKEFNTALDTSIQSIFDASCT